MSQFGCKEINFCRKSLTNVSKLSVGDSGGYV